MKRRRAIVLLVIYVVVFLFTVWMECLSIMNIGMRLLVNGGTLLMTAVGGLLFWIVYRGAEQDKSEKKGQGDGPEDGRESSREGSRDCGRDYGRDSSRKEGIFDKQKYLQFANSCELTRREAEIGLLVLNGYSNMQIAETLYIAETTVKKHLSHIYEKTGTTGRKDFRQAVEFWDEPLEERGL